MNREGSRKAELGACDLLDRTVSAATDNFAGFNSLQDYYMKIK